MDISIPAKIDATEKESGDLDFKSSFNSTSSHDWCELIKDIVAMANSGGGLIIFGVNDDGSPATADLKQLMAVDPATIADKIQRYTNQHFAGCSLSSSSRRGCPVAVLL